MSETLQKPFFHELSADDRKKVLTIPDTTWGEIRDHYAEPSWCQYGENVLLGQWGCWSLLGGLVTNRAFCSNCDQCVDYKEST